jgi:myo-inositol 2-dehydrogenase / D-chiro-inositol 1-dehydrogenase
MVGMGGVAERHATVLAGFDDVELVGATDVDPGRAVAFGRSHGVPVVPDLAALVGLGLDAAYVCVPPFAHGEPERALADAGVALFVEKPLAAHQTVAERIGERIAATGVLTRVGLHWRCAEPVRQARELLAGRRIRSVSGAWLDKVPPVSWWTDRQCSGGPLVEQAVHVIDTARVLAGDIDVVHALSAGPLPGGTVDVATAAVWRFASGAVGTLSTTCALPAKHRAGLEIVADGLAVGLGEDWLEVHDDDGRRRHEFDPWTARVAADRAFVDMVRGRPVDPDGSPPGYAEALASHRVACALARSAAEGRPEEVR